MAVSQRVDVFPDRNEIRDALDQRLVKFLLAAGNLAVPVPNGLCSDELQGNMCRHDLDDWLAAVAPESIVLSGGNDINQCIARDMTEHGLLDYAKAKRIPVLGICRGMQMMAHWAGTGLLQINGHVGSRHYLLGHIAGEVNSYHCYALATCPKDFEVIAHSDDGEIEAIRHLSLPWEGWMWHPERDDFMHDPVFLVRMRELFTNTRKEGVV